MMFYGSVSCLLDQMRDNGRGDFVAFMSSLEKYIWVWRAARRGVALAWLAGMRWEGYPTSGAHERHLCLDDGAPGHSFSTQFTIHSLPRLMLLRSCRSTLEESVPKKKKNDQKQCTLLKWDKVSLSTHVRVWEDEMEAVCLPCQS